jgi:hypothetical protein
MRLITLSDNTLLVEQHRQNSKKILRESCDGLTLDQQRIVEGIYNELSPLLEVALSADQIKNIFQSVEKNATAAGGNRTGLGQGVDTVRQVDTALNKLGKWLQDTAPVKSFDTKFAQLKSKVGKKFPELDKKLTGMGTWAKANPGKTAAIIGVLTTLAALAGGPVGGAIAGQILKGSTELLKGEKLSTAIGKGAKAAAYGFLAGKSIEAIGDMLKGGLDFVADKVFPGLTQSTYIHNNEMIWNVKLATQDADKLQTLTDAASKAMMADDPNFVNLLNKASKFVSDTVNQPGYYDNIVADAATAEKFLNAGNAAAKAMSGIGAAAQGAVTAKTGEKKESYYVQARSLSEGQVYMLFNRIEQLNEGPVWDKVKSGAKKVAAAAGQKISTVGTNLTTKITADKLNSAWTKAGSPTDSEALAKFLKSQGVDDAVISQTFKAMKLKVGDAAQTGYAQVRAQLAQLNTKQKRQLAAYLQKQLGTA